MRNGIVYGAVLGTMLFAPAKAQQPSVSEQILQQTIGVCVGDNARTVQALQEARARIAELEAKLKPEVKK